MDYAFVFDFLLHDLPKEECFSSAAKKHCDFFRLNAIDSDGDGLLSRSQQFELTESDMEGRTFKSAIRLSDYNDIDATAQSSLGKTICYFILMLLTELMLNMFDTFEKKLIIEYL